MRRLIGLRGDSAGCHGVVSVSDGAIRLLGKPRRKGDPLRYALLAYRIEEVRERRSEDEQRRIDARVAEVLARPNVTGWLRLQDFESATTMRTDAATGARLLTDGPFVDSKDYLGGFIIVEAENLDGALAVAGELQAVSETSAIEIRPVLEEPLVRA